MIKHIVLLKPSQHVSEQIITHIFSQLEKLKNMIPGMLAIEAGKNCSLENLERGYQYAFIIAFADQQARDSYLEHPEHQLIARQIIDACENGIEGVLVVDIPGFTA
jgi:hypothetical protein